MLRFFRNLTDAQIMSALKTVTDPDTGQDIVSSNMISGLQIDKNKNVFFALQVSPERGPQLEALRQQAEQAVAKVKGIGKVSAILTAEKRPTDHAQPANTKESQQTAPQAPQQKTPHMDPNDQTPLLEHVKNVIVIASGKGGVGKSTVASNLAALLAQKGYKTGLMDADIYGPSQPLMMGADSKKPEQNEAGKIVPILAHGIKVISIGFMVAAQKAMIWRGPMVQSALIQFMRDVEWAHKEEPLDILLIDMPPGTGDAQLTMAQKANIDGAIIVSTPQDIALLDARKGIEMFTSVKVPVIGLIENMSTYTCPSCGHEDHIFGHNGAKDEAENLGIAFLGALPLDKNIRINADSGVPVVLAKPEASFTKVYSDIVDTIIKGMKI